MFRPLIGPLAERIPAGEGGKGMAEEGGGAFLIYEGTSEGPGGRFFFFHRAFLCKEPLMDREASEE